uniref:AMP-binding domain-containing protein n=1 Tax=Loa loa TaxID=7209 RepID=A0A1I7W007_LOALO
MRNALIRLGIQHGDVIGTYTGNSLDYIIFILAAVSIGAILVPLNPAYKAYEITKYFKEVSVKWILTEEKLFEKIQHLKGENVQAMIFFSSGTTGLPKGVVLNHSALIANVELIRKAQGIRCERYKMINLSSTDVVYGVLPYFHAGGLLTVLGLLGLGVQIIINRKFNGEEFLKTLSNYQVTTALLVPPVLKFFSNIPDLNPEAFHSLKYIFIGSAHVNESLVEIVKRRLPKTNILQCELISKIC